MEEKRLLFIVLSLLVSACSVALGSEKAPSEPPRYLLNPVTEKVSVIYGPMGLPDTTNRGFRNNVVVVRTSEGVVLFDPGGSAYAGEQVVEAVKTLTPAPVVAVFNSHAHGDHWLGNEGVKRSYPDVVIYGHPVMKRKTEGSGGKRWLDMIERLTEGRAGGREIVAPNRVVNDGDVVQIGDTRFRIIHTGPAHSDNDLMIEIVGEDTLFTGDIVRNGLLGIMESDASFEGNIAAIDVITGKGYRHYIPGHGPAGGVEVAERYRTYLTRLLDTVRDLYDQGIADFEMKPRVIEAVADYRAWEGFDLRVGPHVSRAYLEVEADAF